MVVCVCYLFVCLIVCSRFFDIVNSAQFLWHSMPLLQFNF